MKIVLIPNNILGLQCTWKFFVYTAIFSGTLLRNGPGLFEFRDQKADHAFDGMAMIRRYHVDKPSDENQTSPDMNLSRFENNFILNF